MLFSSPMRSKKVFKEFVMAQVGNSEDRFGGEYMIQDRDHMSEIGQGEQNAQRGSRQADQSQNAGRQQGDQKTARKDGQRQAH